jgi:PQQ-like domain
MRLREYQGVRGEPLRRLLTITASLVITLGTVPAVTGMLPGIGVRAARADNFTASHGKLRNGWDRQERALRPAVLRSGRFGRIFSTGVRGQVYAQPLLVGRTLIVVTERDWVYGLNAETGKVKWRDSLGTPWPASTTSCRDLAPTVGITSTPVYDPRTRAVYLIAETIGKSARHPTFRLYGINARTGHITGHVRIGGRPVNDPGLRFNAFSELQRPGLLLLGRHVYAGFGSHCDDRPYTGFIASINVSTRAVRLWTDEAGLTGQDGGIWQSGGGLMSDGPGRIFIATGNGVSPPPGKGSAPPGQLGDSVVRLAVRAGGTVIARDFFSPRNAPALDAANADFGSGAPVGLPFGTSAHRHLLAQAGKDGRLFLLDRDHLGGRSQGRNGQNAYVAKAGPFGGLWGHPAAFGTTAVLTPRNSSRSRDYLYYVGLNDNLRVLRLRVNTRGTPRLSNVANSTQRFGFSSGSPVVTSDGARASTAVVWVVKSSGPSGRKAALDAFRAVPPAHCKRPCAIGPIWSARIGRASKFTIPATDGGRVYVGTRDGRVLGFGSRTRAALAGAAPADFGRTAVGSAASRDITVTASARVTVSGVRTDASSWPDPFSAGQLTKTASGSHAAVPVAVPVTLSRGDALHLRVTFRPAARGGTTGTLSLVTPSARYGSADLPLAGDGTRSGIYAQPGDLGFKLAGRKADTSVPAGIVVPLTANISNGGTTPQTVSSVTAPARPFTAAGLPRPGTIIEPGQSIVVQVSYAPAHAGHDASSITITTADGRRLALPLSGQAQAPVSKIVAAPASVELGRVRLGSRAKATIGITNAGNLPATVAIAAPPGSPFAAAYPVPRGLPVNPGYELRIPVTFAPARPGRATGVYRLTWTDLLGSHTLRVTLAGTGTGTSAVPGRPAGTSTSVTLRAGPGILTPAGRPGPGPAG